MRFAHPLGNRPYFGIESHMRALYLIFLLAFFSNAHAAETFIVSDIRVEGLQRVSAGSVFEAFSINVGDEIDSQRLTSASKRLFKTA